jgi:hypothetical protein
LHGFGGYSYDRAGDLVVYVTDPSEVSTAQSQFEAVLRNKPRSVHDRQWALLAKEGRAAKPAVVVKIGKYTLQQLRDWRDLLDDRVLAIRGVTMFGIDFHNNRLFVSIDRNAPGASVAAVQQAVRDNALPPEAVSIHASTQVAAEDLVLPTGPTADSAFSSCGTFNHSTVRDYVRPLEAGVMICWTDTTGHTRECTLGFVTQYNSDVSFVTASHCSRTVGGLDSTTYFQPNDSIIGFIAGQESYDPAFTTDSGCSTHCRWSDANIVKSAVSAVIGRMGRPVVCDWPNPACNDQDMGWYYIGGTAPYAYFTIEDDGLASDEPAEYDEVWMLGARSGESWGYLQQPCVDANMDYGATLHCQTLADYWSDKGDSGAPVFFWPDTPPYDQYVIFYGINNGFVTDSALGCAWGCGVYSPIAQVKHDLGSIATH